MELAGDAVELHAAGRDTGTGGCLTIAA
jgi:hypothetical protein